MRERACDTHAREALRTVRPTRQAAPAPHAATGGVKRWALASVPGARCGAHDLDPRVSLWEHTPNPLVMTSAWEGVTLVAPATGVAHRPTGLVCLAVPTPAPGLLPLPSQGGHAVHSLVLSQSCFFARSGVCKSLIPGTRFLDFAPKIELCHRTVLVPSSTFFNSHSQALLHSYILGSIGIPGR